MNDFTYQRPDTPEGVDALLQVHGGEARLLAGGTDLLVRMRAGIWAPRHVIDINHLPSLSRISQLSDGAVRVGATARLATIATDPLIRARHRALVEAVLSVGSPQIQHMATLTGNMCNASPAADTAPALLIYDAIVNVRGNGGQRSVAATDFFVSPGVTVLAQDEWVESIDLPEPVAHGSSYVKLGRTRGVDLALVGAAVFSSSTETKVAFASVAPTPLRARRTETLIGTFGVDPDWRAIRTVVRAEARPIDDLRASGSYRMAMTSECLRRAYATAASRERGDTP